MWKKSVLAALLTAGLMMTAGATAEEIAQEAAPKAAPALEEQAKEIFVPVMEAGEVEYIQEGEKFIVRAPFKEIMAAEGNELQIFFCTSYTFDAKSYKANKQQYARQKSIEIYQQGKLRYELAPYVLYKVMDYDQFRYEQKTPKERKAIKLDKNHELHKVSRAKMVKLDMKSSNWNKNEINYSKGYVDLHKLYKAVVDIDNAAKKQQYMRWEIPFWDGGTNVFLWLEPQEVTKLQQVLKYNLYKDQEWLAKLPQAQQAPAAKQ